MTYPGRWHLIGRHRISVKIGSSESRNNAIDCFISKRDEKPMYRRFAANSFAMRGSETCHFVPSRKHWVATQENLSCIYPARLAHSKSRFACVYLLIEDYNYDWRCKRWQNQSRSRLQFGESALGRIKTRPWCGEVDQKGEILHPQKNIEFGDDALEIPHDSRGKWLSPLTVGTSKNQSRQTVGKAATAEQDHKPYERMSQTEFPSW